jgi:hypothetical protein
MAKDGKLEPTERPEPYGPLWETLDKGLEDADVRSKLSVELRISGGMPAQAYYFDFRASGAGAVQSEIRCALSGREGQTKGALLDQKDWMTLLQTIHTSGVLDIPQEAPRFLPDTVVGYLEISDGESKHRLYFAADEEQAKVQDKVPPPELVKVVDTIYRLGSQLLDMPSVKP